MEASDRELMDRLALGDREALGPLMERHHARIYRIAFSYLRDADEALDCVQETFVKVVENASRWDAGAEVAPWLTRIAINDAIDRYRRSKRRARTETPLGEGDQDDRLTADGPSPERVALGRELAERISRALGALPQQQRAVVVLRHYEGMTLPEIAQALGMNLGTVKSSLHRGLERLRERLQGVRP